MILVDRKMENVGTWLGDRVDPDDDSNSDFSEGSGVVASRELRRSDLNDSRWVRRGWASAMNPMVEVGVD